MASTHTVQQGEYLSSIAQQYGFADWHTIYDHPQNADLKRRRPNPNILLAGDEIYIPDKGQRHESGATDQHHKFQVKVPKLWLKINLRDSQGNALANQSYTLKVGSQTYKGSTDGSGLLQEEIATGAKCGELSLDALQLTWTLKIGHLDPVQDVTDNSAIISGVQARLNNLAYPCGTVDGILGPLTRAAIRSFQRDVLGR